MSRRTAFGTTLALPGIRGSHHPERFQLRWDEEVPLHDGRVIVVGLRFFYDRLDRFSEYGRAILRDTELSFDAGPAQGRVTQLFRRVRPLMLEPFEGTWYAVLQGLAGGEPPRRVGHEWGEPQNFFGQRIARLGANGFEPITIAAMPAALQRMNLLHDRAPVQDCAAFDGTLVDLSAKAAFTRKHPPRASDATLIRTRPDRAALHAADNA